MVFPRPRYSNTHLRGGIDEIVDDIRKNVVTIPSRTSVEFVDLNIPKKSNQQTTRLPITAMHEPFRYVAALRGHGMIIID